jgi:hypothetical protein
VDHVVVGLFHEIGDKVAAPSLLSLSLSLALVFPSQSC